MFIKFIYTLRLTIVPFIQTHYLHIQTLQLLKPLIHSNTTPVQPSSTHHRLNHSFKHIIYTFKMASSYNSSSVVSGQPCRKVKCIPKYY